MKKYIQKNKKESYTDNWSTPKNIYSYYVEQLGFFDPCPLNSQSNNLDKLYDKHLFINPPYSDISSWIDFSINNHYKYNKQITLLVPSRTDTKWFHKILDHGAEIQFIKGRLKFGNSKQSAPFPSIFIHLFPKGSL